MFHGRWPKPRRPSGKPAAAPRQLQGHSRSQASCPKPKHQFLPAGGIFQAIPGEEQPLGARKAGNERLQETSYGTSLQGRSTSEACKYGYVIPEETPHSPVREVVGSSIGEGLSLKIPSNIALLGYRARVQKELQAVVGRSTPWLLPERLLSSPAMVLKDLEGQGEQMRSSDKKTDGSVDDFEDQMRGRTRQMAAPEVAEQRQRQQRHASAEAARRKRRRHRVPRSSSIARDARSPGPRRGAREATSPESREDNGRGPSPERRLRRRRRSRSERSFSEGHRRGRYKEAVKQGYGPQRVQESDKELPFSSSKARWQDTFQSPSVFRKADEKNRLPPRREAEGPQSQTSSKESIDPEAFLDSIGGDGWPGPGDTHARRKQAEMRPLPLEDMPPSRPPAQGDVSFLRENGSWNFTSQLQCLHLDWD